jgi:hypothetical protein
LNHWPICLIGVIVFGFIALSASVVLLAHRPSNFAAATCKVGPVGCTSPNSLNSFSGLIGQIGLISHNGPIRFIGLNHVGFKGLIGLIGHISHIGFGFNGLIGISIINNSLLFEIKTKLSQCCMFVRESWFWCARRVFSSLAGLDSVF